MEFSGRLTSFPISELLQWAHNDRRTGSLVVRRSSREKRIYFEEGRVVACITDAPAEFYGQHLLLNGYLDRKTLLRCLSLCKDRNKRLGEILQEEEILDLPTIQRTLRNQIEDVICDIFLWRHGIFFFLAEPPPPEEILAEPIATVGLVLEGTRWIDEIERIRKVFEDDNFVLGRVPGVSVEELDPRKKALVLALDGERPLAKLYRVVNGSYFRFLVAAYELRADGVVELLGVSDEVRTTSTELPLYDLLFEQAAEEQMRSSRRHFASPIGSFERYVPVWVREPDAEEWNRMPERAREFYRKFDGNTRLTDIFSRDEDQWSREAELLMLQIGKEAVALMPAPLAELEDRGIASSKRWWKKVLG